MEMTPIEDDDNNPNEVLTSMPVGLIKIATDASEIGPLKVP
jgi:hypothetical protein